MRSRLSDVQSGRCALVALCLLLANLNSSQVTAAEPAKNGTRRDLLEENQWKQLDSSIDRGLEFLARQQRPDGSFAAPELGQPGITSLSVLAFLARGHAPGKGPYGRRLEQAVDFVLAQQRENGVLFKTPYDAAWHYGTPAHTGIYNHAISGVMLGEVYGLVESDQAARIETALESAVRFTREQQLRRKRRPIDKGGWRYIVTGEFSGLQSDADLSITSWQLMFLRSARNAGFDIPAEPIDDAMEYVRGSFDPKRGTFTYGRLPPGNHTSRAMAGSGILALSLGGEHETEIAKSAGDWILKHPFDQYNMVINGEERYHYSVYYCSQGMFQLGGDRWAAFYPRLMNVLLQNQQRDGSWPAEKNRDTHFGNAYTTALVILALTPPYQLLPIYQR